MAKKKEIREKNRRETEKKRGIPADRLEADDTKRQKNNR